MSGPASGGDILPAEDPALRYSSDAEPGIRRDRRGKGFSYRRADGSLVGDAGTKRRIRALAVPPAWTDVWICAEPHGHIQATGRDARGRKQYRYHPAWVAERSRVKYEGLADFGRRLPAIRRAVERDLNCREDMRTQIVAAAVSLLDSTLVRVGNAEYERENGTYGLTTLTSDHVRFSRDGLTLEFEGKHHKRASAHVHDRRLARLLRRCEELPGQLLLQYRERTGAIGHVTSDDVNEYLAETSGADYTARTFRTWGASVMLAAALAALPPVAGTADAERKLREAIKPVAARLGNTVATCRTCYVHPMIAELYVAGDIPSATWARMADHEVDGLSRDERFFLRLLEEHGRPAK